MNKKLAVNIIVISFFFGAAGSIILGRFVLPALATVKGFSWVNDLVSNAPIIVTRTQEVQFTEGVDLTGLLKQAGNVVVGINSTKDAFLANGLIVTSDGLIVTSSASLQNQTEVNVVTSDGQKLVGTVKNKDAKTGLAFLTVPAKDLPVIQLEDAVNLKPGQRVVVIGRGNVNFEHAVLVRFITQSLNNQLDSKQVAIEDVSSDYLGGSIVNLSGHVVGMVLSNGQNITAEDIKTALSQYLAKK